VASLCGESSGALGRDLVTGKQYSCVSASTTWTRGGLVPTDTTDKSRVKSLLLLIPFTFPHLLYCNLCLPLLSLSSILLILAIGCKPCFGMGVSH
jgi:hypothetical protein